MTSLSTEIDELYKMISEIRTLLWADKRLQVANSPEANEEKKHLANQVALTRKQLRDFIDQRTKEFYEKMSPGSLVVMTSYWGTSYGLSFAKDTTPKLESGDIFLYLGLSENGTPRWLIEEKVHDLPIPVTSFRVLSKNVKDVVKKLP